MHYTGRDVHEEETTAGEVDLTGYVPPCVGLMKIFQMKFGEKYFCR